MGGVFHQTFPLLADGMGSPYDHIWVWQADDEEAVLRAIYQYFQNAWSVLKGKSTDLADLMAVGVGISRFDVPVLFSRSLIAGIASRSQLFACYFKLKTIDLSEVGVAICPGDPVLYPKTANQLAKALGLPRKKQSGRRVWDLYDAEDFNAIETRTEAEVRDAVQIYDHLRERLYLGESLP